MVAYGADSTPAADRVADARRRPVEAVAPSGEPKRPICVTIEVVRDKPLLVSAGPDKPALPGQLRGLPFRASDGGQAPTDIGVNDGAYRTR
jgi:hypothetical protein